MIFAFQLNCLQFDKVASRNAKIRHRQQRTNLLKGSNLIADSFCDRQDHRLLMVTILCNRCNNPAEKHLDALRIHRVMPFENDRL